ncbi:MAG: hypothetical protein ACLRLP_01265 [Lachnospira sp.]
MDEERKKQIEQLKTASPLEATKILQQMEMYDEKSSQEVIDEVYRQFQTGENMKDEVLKPVFMSVIDGLLEATAGGRAARKKGLTASRVLRECEQFSYDNTGTNTTSVNGYTEYKNAREFDDTNSHMSQQYDRSNYEDKSKMEDYKASRVHGEKTITDEYTGKDNLYEKRNNPNQHYNDDTYRKQAQPDHIVPLKQIHERFKSNYALDDADIKHIANQDYNLAVTSAEINQTKKEMSNRQYIEYMDEKGNSVDETTRQNMKNLERNATKKIDQVVNKTIINNLLGNDNVKVSTQEQKAAEDEYRKNNNGKSPDKQQREQITKDLQKKKANEIRGTAAKNAASQAKDYAVGNLILFIVKPIYYEMSDTFKNGLTEGVNASSGMEAIKIRFGRIKKHVMTHAKAFFGDNLGDFIKGFISSLVEGIISLFVGVFKQVLKLLKEGIKIFVQSAKILFGKDSKAMSAAEKGDAIIKLLGGSVIAIAGIGLESLINKIGIGEPWSVVLSTMLSGIASALFMYLLNKADIFSVKAQKRHDRIIEIFDERIKDIDEAVENCNVVAIETFKRQREHFEQISEQIQGGLDCNSIETINEGLYQMADFMQVDLPYSNTDEFCDYMDSEEAISL